ncbi:MAG: type I restriction endonuclease subunit R [Candidatus Magasanikbacteria bacterium]|jgi:type I restriction enzyme, R subunit|nr:type I restriction endonuclease subunit R [Candidatus Magasanikbacteria bacterium]
MTTQTFKNAHFDEARQSQLPFCELLINMGYTYLPTSEVMKQRQGDTGKFILRDIAFDALSRINEYEVDDEVKKFTDKDIWEVVTELENVKLEGLIDTSKNIFNLIMPTTGGKSVKVFHDGKAISKSLRYIDFENPKNNSFHVAVEFEATARGSIRPDIVVFVNGIPFAIIENKKAGVEVSEALAQQVRNQGAEKCPQLFVYPQLLVGTNGSELKYGTTGTPTKFYASWKEKSEDDIDKYLSVEDQNGKILPYIQEGIRGDVYAQLLLDLNGAVTGHKQKTNREVTEQDRGIFYLFKFERLLDLCKNYVLFDAGLKKISRYQQYFAIHKMLHRIEEREDTKMGTKRKGGLVWHTQGSGKSLTMVMFVKALIEHPQIKNPRIIIVTDRRDLDKQISETFKGCNLKKDVYRTTTGKDLLKQIKNKNLSVVTTLVHKFAAVDQRGMKPDLDDNIFVLIDEAHRTQSGIANLEMNRIIPNACYIGFTGTPLMKKEKASYLKFGGYIDKYTIDDALRDNIILPLIYEGRYVDLEQQDDQIDRKIERVLESVSDADKTVLQKFISKKIIKSNPGRILEIAYDVVNHYKEHFQGTGLKAQLVAPSKFAAVLFQTFFEARDDIQSAVVISDESGIILEDDDHKKEVDEYLKKIKEKYSGLNSYERDVIDSFKNNEDGIEIIIVVDKLLTGFDAPRNTVLYLAKDLKDHNLLQAIARVNRLFDNEIKPKTAGYIIDYSENAKNLQQAMQLFTKFDEDDVKNTLIDIDEKISELEQAYSSVHDFFNGVNKDDSEALIVSLHDEVNRETYYDHVRGFVRVFNECLALQEFPNKFQQIDLYKKELKTFLELRKAASVRYADKVNLGEYKRSLVKILDKYVDASGIELLTEQIDIANASKFQETINTLGKDSAKAEAIAAQTERTIQEKYREADPEFYTRFSHKIKAILDDMRSGKLADAKALGQMQLIREEALVKKDDSLPKEIAEDQGAGVLYRNIEIDLGEDKVRIVVGIAEVIKDEAIIDWYKNGEVQRIIMNKIDDFLYDTVQGEWGVTLTSEQMKNIAELSIDLAQKNHEQFSV